MMWWNIEPGRVARVYLVAWVLAIFGLLGNVAFLEIVAVYLFICAFRSEPVEPELDGSHDNV